jgi:hypothetical protein
VNSVFELGAAKPTARARRLIVVCVMPWCAGDAYSPEMVLTSSRDSSARSSAANMVGEPHPSAESWAAMFLIAPVTRIALLTAASSLGAVVLAISSPCFAFHFNGGGSWLALRHTSISCSHDQVLSRSRPAILRGSSAAPPPLMVSR